MPTNAMWYLDGILEQKEVGLKGKNVFTTKRKKGRKEGKKEKTKRRKIELKINVAIGSNK